METFAVLWSGRPGKLEVDATGLCFVGPGGDERVGYADIERVHIARDRGGGRPALVLDLVAGGALRIASLGGIGILTEIAERLA